MKQESWSILLKVTVREKLRHISGLLNAKARTLEHEVKDKNKSYQREKANSGKKKNQQKTPREAKESEEKQEKQTQPVTVLGAFTHCLRNPYKPGEG